MKYIFILVLLISGCKQAEKVYECNGWDKRLCVCPNGDPGRQKCSRGPAFADPPPVRTWLPCDCCYDTKRDEHGIYYININDTSGCWDDTYDPSTPSYDADSSGPTE